MNAIALVCTAALGLLLFGLGLSVSMCRFRTKTGFAFPNQPDAMMCKLVRAHGNTAEFAPFIAILMLLLGSRPVAAWVVDTMIATTVSRFLIVLGLLLSPTLARPHPLRFLGALGTYLGGVMLCVAVLLNL